MPVTIAPGSRPWRLWRLPLSAAATIVFRKCPAQAQRWYAGR